jgi:hypothetical protein
MTVTGLQPGSIRNKLEELKQSRANRRAEALARLDSANAKHDQVDQQLETIASQIEKEADDALQEFAAFTNGGPA